MTAIERSLIGLSMTAIFACNGERTVSEEDAPREQAATECRLLFDCDCEPGYETEQECTEQRQDTYESQWGILRASDLTWDGSCLGAYLDELEGQGCAPPDLDFDQDDFDDLECTAPCLPYHGNVGLGDACQVYSGVGFSNCAQGTVCFNEVCVDPCAGFDEGLAAGEACRDGFEVLGDCGEGLVCDAGGSDTCIALPGPGQACPQNQCAEGSFCQQIITDTMCVAQLPNGMACNDAEECIGGHCIQGSCSDLPQGGQPCAGECAEGFSCESGVCVAPAMEGQPCSTVSCDVGLVCVDSFCMAGPSEGQPCLEGQCAEAFMCGPEETCVPRRAAVCDLQ